MSIPLFKVYMASDVDSYILPVLKSGYIGEGSKVKEFESALGKFINSDKILAVNSCTSAIQMALRLAGVNVGDYVISTPMTCLATNEPILALGAIPIWADVHKVTGNIDARSVKDILDADVPAHNIRAIVCVDWGGYPCDYTELCQLSIDYGVPLVEDAAQGFGSIYKEDTIGNWADYTCFSFQAIKYITTGDGGAIAFRRKEDLERARLMRWYGLDRDKSIDMRCMQDPLEYGYKMHMNNISAAIGLANIKELSILLMKSHMNAKAYDKAFEHLPAITICPSDADKTSTYWLYTIIVDDSKGFIAYMKAAGIECSKVHDRNDTKKIFSHCPKVDLPNTEYFDSRHVCLPVGWWLSRDDIKKIIDAVNSYV